ncbi:phospholipid carrier-dependent glycosyltransferase [Gammaproteobacteria bacterium]|nr:phospholipid carrier-dependent glycosyltransferase [Gammaproteobacteria bacterium]
MQSIKLYLPIGFLLLIGSILRFYNLGQIPWPVFDEVFYPVFAFNYLEDKNFFSVHPPLGSYLLSLGIYLYHLLPWTEAISFGITDIEDINPLAFRWVSALSGVMLIYVGYKLALEIFNQRGFALLVALFLTLDGSLLVDSRFGLINIFFSLFGLMAMLFFIKGIKGNSLSYFALAGFLLGAAVSVKWNGLGFWLSGLLLTLQFFILHKYITHHRDMKEVITIFHLKALGLVFLFPFAVYLAFWLPDLLHNNSNLIDQHSQMISYHFENTDQKSHPYSSPWYTWPMMIRPIAYFFESGAQSGSIIIDVEVFKAIHLFPNPALNFFSLIAVVILSLKWIGYLSESLGNRKIRDELYLSSFIMFGFYANFLPWALASRSTFIYHYQPAAIFSFFALAYFIYRLMQRNTFETRLLYSFALVLILLSSIYWLPIQLGLEISDESFYSKMWLDSWI